MRLNDLSDGSIKTLLIFLLLGANIALALPRHGTESQPPTKTHHSSGDREIPRP